MAQACNTNSSGGKDQEDHGLKAAWANSSQDSILKKPFTKIGVPQGVGPEFKPQSAKTNKQKLLLHFWSIALVDFRKCSK
jgi:hypothetical protein